MEYLYKKPLPKKPESKPPRPKAPPLKAEPADPPGPDIPYWIPNDAGWKKLPQQVREAVPRILAPAYRRFVLEAPGELERSVGLTLVHLTWLELCNQIQLAVASAPDSLEAILKDPEDLLERHLRLATVKCQTAELLLKVQVVQNALQRSGHSHGLPSSVPALPVLPPPMSPLPLGEGQGEGRSTSSPLPLGEGQGEGRSTSSPLPLGEGQGEGRRTPPQNADRVPDLRDLFPLPTDSEGAEIGNPSLR